MAVKVSIAKIIIHFISYLPHKRFLNSLEEPEKVFNRTLKKINDSNKKTNKIIFYETTSGTTSKKKEIPYTKKLIRSFRNMFLIWTRDILNNSNIELKSGKIFMSISPKVSQSAIKDDSDYVGILKWVLQQFLAVDPSLQAQTYEMFMSKISKQLMECKDLEILSLWSPSYFLSILDYIAKNNFDRESYLEVNWSTIWPNLKLISCWSSAQAKAPSEELRSLFPHVCMQPKGLLATEAPMTIPWTSAKGSLPLISEVAIELKDQFGTITPCWKAKVGETYEILITAPNGQYRNAIGDLVLCMGFYKKLPILEFVGRKGVVSDIVGEKLDEPIVREVLNAISKNYILLPAKNKYLLFAEDFYEEMSEKADMALRGVYHYDLARNLGQLASVEARHVKDLRGKWLVYNQNKGKSAGDIKEVSLISDAKVSEDFQQFVLTNFAISGKL